MNNSDHTAAIEKIKELKKKHNAIIAAHNYQRQEIQMIADFNGDSLELAKLCANTDADTIVFCGVRFMAETAKILSPSKTVLLPRNDADCPMAHMITPHDLNELQRKHPGAVTATYVNSTAETKAVSDICITSGNAIELIKKLKAKKVIIGPDKNLANYCQRFTDKEIIAWEGFCYVHARFSVNDIEVSRKHYPGAPILTHPECAADVIDASDHTFSTAGMIKFIEQYDYPVYVIATEEGLISRMARLYPNKKFVSAGTVKVCQNMKKTHVEDVLAALETMAPEILLSDEIMSKARGSLTAMLHPEELETRKLISELL